MLVELFILVGLVQAFIYKERPIVFAALYTVLTGIWGLLMYTLLEGDLNVLPFLLVLLIKGVASYIYFWLLYALDGLFWWIILPVGLVGLLLL